MSGLFDAFWRAAAYCLHPRVMLLSLAPVLLAGGAVLGLGWWFWGDAVDGVQTALSHWTLSDAVLRWLESMGFQSVRAFLVPMILVLAAVPMVVMLSLLLVALLMTPAIVSLVASRRFPSLEMRRGASGWQAAAWSIGVSVVAVLLLTLSLPLFLLPVLGLLLPPLIWGWACGRIFAFDALAEHADALERRTLLKAHRGPLLAMGVISGVLGLLSSLVWSLGLLVLGMFAFAFAPLILIVSVWLYTLVFAFASAWFAHYMLAALQALRAVPEAPVLDLPPAPPPAPLLPTP